MLRRPDNRAASIQNAIAAAGSDDFAELVESWQKLVDIGGGEGNAADAGTWEPLDSRDAATLSQQLRALAKMACCDYLAPHIKLHSDGSDDGSSAEQADETPAGLVILDANGGPVTVLQQSWKQMMESKLQREQ